MTACDIDPAWPKWSAPPQRIDAGAGQPALAAALAWIESQGQAMGLPSKALFALNLCADEALANITEHAQTPAQAPANIWLACGPTHTGFALEITDNGYPFDPTRASPKALASNLEDAEIGGHGLRLMRHYLQAMVYRRDQDRNILLLEVDGA